MGGVNGLCRDRSADPDAPAELVCWVAELRPGDTEIDEATYKSEAARLLDLSYTNYFVPVAEEAEAAWTAALADHDAEDNAVVNMLGQGKSAGEIATLRKRLVDAPERTKVRARLVELKDKTTARAGVQRAERDAIKADRVAGRDCMNRHGRWPVAQPTPPVEEPV
jgi:hypothetical protein